MQRHEVIAKLFLKWGALLYKIVEDPESLSRTVGILSEPDVPENAVNGMYIRN